MPIPDLKHQLATLVRLQEIDSEIYTLRAEKAAKPLEIKTLEDTFEQKKTHLAELEKKGLDLQRQRKDKELELASKNENVGKLKNQLYSLKTNKEYQTMLQQIQDAQTDSSVIEDKILEVMVQGDGLKTEIEQEKIKVKEEESKFLARKKVVEDRIREIDGILDQRGAGRKQILPDVDPKLLAQYERILLNRDGLAIVTIKHETCGGCNMTTPPQVVNLIKMYDRIVMCETCNRILYVEE